MTSISRVFILTLDGYNAGDEERVPIGKQIWDHIYECSFTKSILSYTTCVCYSRFWFICNMDEVESMVSNLCHRGAFIALSLN